MQKRNFGNLTDSDVENVGDEVPNSQPISKKVRCLKEQNTESSDEVNGKKIVGMSELPDDLNCFFDDDDDDDFDFNLDVLNYAEVVPIAKTERLLIIK